MPADPHKRELRKLKRTLKRAGSKHRRRDLKRAKARSRATKTAPQIRRVLASSTFKCFKSSPRAMQLTTVYSPRCFRKNSTVRLHASAATSAS